MKLQTLQDCTTLILFSFICFISCGTPEERAMKLELQSGPKTDTIIIHQMQFDPAGIYVKAGDTVVWKNNDIVTHNITEETSKEWTSSALPAGQSWKMVVEKSADYFCSLHPVMKGKLILK